MATVYDDIIVGAGSAGAVLAARLSEDPHRSVLLLEAGPDYPTEEQTPTAMLRLNSGENSIQGHDWDLTATAVEDRQIGYPRGKVVGGSSAVNGAMALRGVPADYDEWAALDNDVWRWANVLPYFQRLEDDRDEQGEYHGADGPIPVRRYTRDELHPVSRAFIDACRALGFPEVRDHNHPESTGAGPWPMNRHDGTRVSTALGYLLPARHRLNLMIRPDCLVHRVRFDGDRAVGVEVECGGQIQQVFSRRVTLSAGALGSPAILLRSGIGPRAELETLGITPRVDRPGVGANLIDHPWCWALFVPALGDYDLSTPYVQAGLRYTATGSDEFNDMQAHVFYPWDAADFADIVSPVETPVVLHMSVALQRPRSRGHLSLTSAEPHAPPRIALNYLADPEDTRRLVDGLRLVWRLSQTPPLAQHIVRTLPCGGMTLNRAAVASDELVRAYVRRNVTTIFHPVGTARMGPDGDDGAVVDQYCRVRGVEGLFVVDASVMPTIPRANTNLTCIMIAERVADWMR